VLGTLRAFAKLGRCPVSDSLDGDDVRVITDSEVLALLVERVGADHLAWINGESGGYEFADEQSTILGASGGATVGASMATPGQRRAVARFEAGTGSVEMIIGGVSGDVGHAGIQLNRRPEPATRREHAPPAVSRCDEPAGQSTPGRPCA